MIRTTITTVTTLTAVALTLILTGCGEAPDSASTSQSDEPQAATEAKAKEKVKEKEKPRQQAPAAASLPAIPDFGSYTDVAEKKRVFFDFMLDLTERVDAEVLAERQQVQQWQPAKGTPEQIASLLEKYRVDESLAPAAAKTELLERVQVIPPSLVLAQGANESAWGTSRFARQGNNFFGQWCFSKGCGLVPKQRNDGAVHEVADFDHPLDSVRSYVLNLNRHYTYDKLRDLRKQEIQRQGYPTGHTLAAGLEKYSERGEEYVKEIRSMISYNKLDRLDKELLDSTSAGQ